MRKLLNATGIVLALTCMVWAGASYAEPAKTPAPDFTLKSTGGKNIKLGELRGEVVMINFWASWCGPCRQEMPLLDKLYKQYKALGFTLLGVNVEEDETAARRLLKDIPVSFPVLLDSRQAVSKAYQVNAMPSTVLVDRDGNVRYLHRGYQGGDEAEYERQVKALVKE